VSVLTNAQHCVSCFSFNIHIIVVGIELETAEHMYSKVIYCNSSFSDVLKNSFVRNFSARIKSDNGSVRK